MGRPLSDGRTPCTRHHRSGRRDSSDVEGSYRARVCPMARPDDLLSAIEQAAHDGNLSNAELPAIAPDRLSPQRPWTRSFLEALDRRLRRGSIRSRDTRTLLVHRGRSPPHPPRDDRDRVGRPLRPCRGGHRMEHDAHHQGALHTPIQRDDRRDLDVAHPTPAALRLLMSQQPSFGRFSHRSSLVSGSWRAGGCEWWRRCTKRGRGGRLPEQRRRRRGDGSRTMPSRNPS